MSAVDPVTLIVPASASDVTVALYGGGGSLRGPAFRFRLRGGATCSCSLSEADSTYAAVFSFVLAGLLVGTELLVVAEDCPKQFKKSQQMAVE